MGFELEALSARNGDALLLKWGASGKEKVVLVDGGPSGVWDGVIHPRLTEIAGSDPAGAPLPIGLPLVVVTHVDDDHVRGILDMAEEIDQAQKRAEPIPVLVAEVWHNAFSDLARTPEILDTPDLVRALREVDASPTTLETAAPNQSGADTPQGLMATAESIRQGTQLEQVLRTVNIPRNISFVDGFVRAGESTQRNGLTIRVLAPSQESLNQLKDLWDKTPPPTDRESVKALAAAFDDPSVPNMSSIVLLAEFEGQTMLLTGDARGDHILEAVKGATGSDTLHVDLLKIPHHGSAHSNSGELFSKVTADHYVISGNGEHGNPHPDTLEALFETQKDRTIHLYLTNMPPGDATKPDDLKKSMKAAQVLAAAKEKYPNVSVHVRDSDDLGVRVTL